MKKRKMSLSSLTVKSFTTNIERAHENTVKGGVAHPNTYDCTDQGGYCSNSGQTICATLIPAGCGQLTAGFQGLCGR